MEQLPVEILAPIFGHFSLLPEDTDSLILYKEQKADQSRATLFREHQKKLASICLVCKLFRDVAQPLLFATYNKSLSSGPAGASLRLFLRSILHRRDLAATLKSITLVAAGASVKHPCDSELTVGASELLARTPAGMDILKGLQQGYENADDALLLSLAPNLSHLELTLPFYPGPYQVKTDDFHVHSLIREAACADGQSENFSGLRVLFVSARTAYCLSLDMLFDMLCLPNLEEFKMQGSCDDPDNPGQYVFRPAKSPVRVVQLDRCCFGPVTLKALVETCARLNMLHIHFSAERPGRRPDIRWPTIVQAIHSQRSTLQHLALTAQPTSKLVGYIDDAWAPVGSLTHFTALCSLCIHSRALVGRTRPDDNPDSVGDDSALRYRSEVDIANVLPSSLERLTFVDANPTILLWTLERLLRVLRERLPLLKELAFDGVSGRKFIPTARGNNDIKERLTRLIAGYESAGVVWIDDCGG